MSVSEQWGLAEDEQEEVYKNQKMSAREDELCSKQKVKLLKDA